VGLRLGHLKYVSEKEGEKKSRLGWEVGGCRVGCYAVRWVQKKSQHFFFGSPGAEKADKGSQTVLA
jgi:hypothetical protein